MKFTVSFSFTWWMPCKFQFTTSIQLMPKYMGGISWIGSFRYCCLNSTWSCNESKQMTKINFFHIQLWCMNLPLPTQFRTEVHRSCLFPPEFYLHRISQQHQSWIPNTLGHLYRSCPVVKDYCQCQVQIDLSEENIEKYVACWVFNFSELKWIQITHFNYMFCSVILININGRFEQEVSW